MLLLLLNIIMNSYLNIWDEFQSTSIIIDIKTQMVLQSVSWSLIQIVPECCEMILVVFGSIPAILQDRCIRLIMYNSRPRLGISYFSKKPWASHSEISLASAGCSLLLSQSLFLEHFRIPKQVVKDKEHTHAHTLTHDLLMILSTQMHEYRTFTQALLNSFLRHQKYCFRKTEDDRILQTICITSYYTSNCLRIPVLIKLSV